MSKNIDPLIRYMEAINYNQRRRRRTPDPEINLIITALEGLKSLMSTAKEARQKASI